MAAIIGMKEIDAMMTSCTVDEKVRPKGDMFKIIFRLYAFGLRKRKIEANLRLRVVHFESTRGGTL
jgi:hypothetical protein